jgi:hypothetical protein
VVLWIAIALTVVSGLDILWRGWQERRQRSANAV